MLFATAEHIPSSFSGIVSLGLSLSLSRHLQLSGSLPSLVDCKGASLYLFWVVPGCPFRASAVRRYIGSQGQDQEQEGQSLASSMSAAEVNIYDHAASIKM